MPHPLRACRRRFSFRAAALILAALPSAAFAADCGNDAGGFARLAGALQGAGRRRRASRAAAIDSALAGVSYDTTVIRLDRNQHSFKLSFEQFYARRVGTALVRRAQERLGGPSQGDLRQGRAAVWRASGEMHRRDLGPRDQLRRRYVRQIFDHPLIGDARLRLPPVGVLHWPQFYDAIRIVDRRDMTPERDARRLGGRDRPDPVPAEPVRQVCGGFRRRPSP